MDQFSGFFWPHILICYRPVTPRHLHRDGSKVAQTVNGIEIRWRLRRSGMARTLSNCENRKCLGWNTMAAAFNLGSIGRSRKAPIFDLRFNGSFGWGWKALNKIQHPILESKLTIYLRIWSPKSFTLFLRVCILSRCPRETLVQALLLLLSPLVVVVFLPCPQISSRF